MSDSLSALPRIRDLFTGLMFLLLIPSLGAAQDRLTLRELTPRAFALIGSQGNANSGFIINREGVVVVDSQMNEEHGREMLRIIREKTQLPILYVINTHHHGDHTFANHVFEPVRGIIAHEAALKFLQEHGQEHLRQFEQFYGRENAKGTRVTLPTRSLKEDLMLQMDQQKVEIHHFGPAHTQGDVIVYLPGEKILFTGDLVYVGRLPWLGDGNTRSWLKALEGVKSLDFTHLVPGHGPVGDRGSLKRFEAYLTALRAAVLTGMLRGLSLDEMKKTIRLPEYEQDLKYAEWLPLHVEKVYREMTEEP